MNPSAPGVEVPSFFVDVGGIGGRVRRAGIHFNFDAAIDCRRSSLRGQ